MTRINSAIPVERLTDEHLLAEHREIKRMPGSLIRAIKSGSINRIPKKFCLGKGHVTFFVDKSKFTLNRYRDIHKECLRRGFNVEDYSSNWDIEECLKYNNNHIPTIDEKNLLIDRITTRINNSPKNHWHYLGERISKTDAINLLCHGCI